MDILINSLVIVGCLVVVYGLPCVAARIRSNDIAGFVSAIVPVTAAGILWPLALNPGNPIWHFTAILSTAVCGMTPWFTSSKWHRRWAPKMTHVIDVTQMVPDGMSYRSITIDQVVITDPPSAKPKLKVVSYDDLTEKDKANIQLPNLGG